MTTWCEDQFSAVQTGAVLGADERGGRLDTLRMLERIGLGDDLSVSQLAQEQRLLPWSARLAMHALRCRRWLLATRPPRAQRN